MFFKVILQSVKMTLSSRARGAVLSVIVKEQSPAGAGIRIAAKDEKYLAGF